jgi:hypothetical protein
LAIIGVAPLTGAEGVDAQAGGVPQNPPVQVPVEQVVPSLLL